MNRWPVACSTTRVTCSNTGGKCCTIGRGVHISKRSGGGEGEGSGSEEVIKPLRHNV